jgi:acetate kinase
MLGWVAGAGLSAAPDAVGHRILHGAARLGQPTVIDPDVVRSIGEAEELAPLHNRPGLAGIEACRRRLMGPRRSPTSSIHTASWARSFKREMDRRFDTMSKLSPSSLYAMAEHARIIKTKKGTT